MIKFEKLVLGDLETNCYLLWSESKKALIIDPADSGVEISEEIQRLGLHPLGILLTHGHFDHILGVLELKMIYNLPVYGHKADKKILRTAGDSATYWLKKKTAPLVIKEIDVDLSEVQGVTIDDEDLIEVVPSPGHTPGSVCFYCPKEGWLFSGDTIFDGSLGTTKYQYGDPIALKASLKTIIKKLPEDTEVLPGHGGPTTLKETARLVI